MSNINWIFTSLLLLIGIFAIHGSHFQGGTISYKVVGTSGSQLIVRITQSYTYVYPTIYCTNTYIANQQNLVLSPYGDATATLVCIANCSTSGGYTPIPVASKCTDYSSGMSITVGQRTDDVLLDNGSYFVVAYRGSAFRSLNLSSNVGSPANWSISAVIDLRMRPDGTYNTPPLATMISPIYIPVGVQQSISIPTIDTDSDNVRCRFASGSNECSSVCPPTSLPSGTSISSGCVLSITGAHAGDWYAVAIQVEDFADPTSTTRYSSVPVQFLVNVYAQPACTQRPYLYGPNPDGTCTSVQVGVPYTLQLIAENYCSSYGVTMVDIATQSFPIVIKTPIVQNTSTLWSVSLTWTPTANQVGSQVFCSVGIDTQSVQTNQYCLTFMVGNGTLGTCPTVATITTEELTTESPTTESPTPCREIDVEQECKPVTMYTIEGAYINRVSSIIGEKYNMNENDDNNSGRWTDTSHVSLDDTNFYTKPLPSKTLRPMSNDHNSTSVLTHKNIPVTLDTPFNTNDGHRMMTHHSFFPLTPLSPKNTETVQNSATGNIYGDQTTISYDHYSPSQLPTKLNASNGPATSTNKTYSDNIQKKIDSFHLSSSSSPSSQSMLLSNRHHPLNDDLTKSDVRSASTAWTKHPRWVLRLSEPKQIRTPPLLNNRPLSKEQPRDKLSSSSRSTATIPRYAFFYEQ